MYSAIYLSEGQEVRKRHQSWLPSVGSFLKRLRQPGLGQAKGRSSEPNAALPGRPLRVHLSTKPGLEQSQVDIQALQYKMRVSPVLCSLLCQMPVLFCLFLNGTQRFNSYYILFHFISKAGVRRRQKQGEMLHVLVLFARMPIIARKQPGAQSASRLPQG